MSINKIKIIKEKLLKDKEHLYKQIEAIKNQIIGIDSVLRILDTTVVKHKSNIESSSKINLKQEVLDTLIISSKPLSAKFIYNELVKAKLVTDIRISSITSLLSRLKKDNILGFDNGKYFILKGKENELKKPNNIKEGEQIKEGN